MSEVSLEQREKARGEEERDEEMDAKDGDALVGRWSVQNGSVMVWEARIISLIPTLLHVSPESE